MDSLRNATRPDGTKVYNVPVALSIMVFFALCAQCAGTLMTIKRETNRWIWPVFTFVYMTTLAYVGAFAHVSDRHAPGMTHMTWDWQQIVALGLVAAAAFLLARRAIHWWKSSAAPGCAVGMFDLRPERSGGAPIQTTRRA